MGDPINFRMTGRLQNWYDTLSSNNKSEVIREMIRVGIESTGVNKENYKLNIEKQNQGQEKQSINKEEKEKEQKSNTTEWNFPE
mgnify:CR=1 FL=1